MADARHRGFTLLLSLLALSMLVAASPDPKTTLRTTPLVNKSRPK